MANAGASSGPDPGTPLNLESALLGALEREVPVIVSAGSVIVTRNQVLDQAGQFVPAKYGVMDGIITVGATEFSDGGGNPPTLEHLNPIPPWSNTDDSKTIISLYAPGGGVDTGFGITGGTSWSCALTAGLAATYLSIVVILALLA